MNEFKHKVVEDIVTPGLIIKNAGAAKTDDRRIKVKMFSLSAGGEEVDPAFELETLLNREDVVIIDYHKFTFNNTFNVVITYQEPNTNG